MEVLDRAAGVALGQAQLAALDQADRVVRVLLQRLIDLVQPGIQLGVNDNLAQPLSDHHPLGEDQVAGHFALAAPPGCE